MHKILSEIEKIIHRVVDQMGYEVVDIEMGGTKRPTLTIYIYDPKSPITVAQLRSVSRTVSDELDIADIISGKYYLVVSSPGLDRPLKSRRDFERNEGEAVKITMVDGKIEKGKIVSTRSEQDDDYIVIERENGKYDIPLKEVKKGFIEIKP